MNIFHLYKAESARLNDVILLNELVLPEGPSKADLISHDKYGTKHPFRQHPCPPH